MKLWPYNLSLTLKWYDFGRLGTDGWGPYFNSLRLAAMASVIGTAIIFCGAYLVEKGRGAGRLRAGLHLLAMIPLAVPGIVLGLAYIFFFNAPGNPLELHLQHHGDPGGEHGLPFLYGLPSDGGDRLEAG